MAPDRHSHREGSWDHWIGAIPSPCARDRVPRLAQRAESACLAERALVVARNSKTRRDGRAARRLLESSVMSWNKTLVWCSEGGHRVPLVIRQQDRCAAVDAHVATGTASQVINAPRSARWSVLPTKNQEESR